MLRFKYLFPFFFQISHFKIPRYIKFIDEFPLTVTGKVRMPGTEKGIHGKIQNHSGNLRRSGRGVRSHFVTKNLLPKLMTNSNFAFPQVKKFVMRDKTKEELNL